VSILIPFLDPKEQTVSQSSEDVKDLNMLVEELIAGACELVTRSHADEKITAELRIA
jgi:hypothetical protein